MAPNTAVAEKNEVELDGEESRRYELSFHLIPTLSEDEVASTVSAIKGQIEERGGSFVGEQAPEKIKLAYAIQKDIDRKRHTYTEGYFGWIQFVALPSAAHEVKESLLANDAVLRSLMVKIAEILPVEEKEEREEKESDAGSDVTSEEEMDKEIDKLVEDPE